MAQERLVLDISSSPELLRLVEEIEQTGAEFLLVRGDEELALVTQLPLAARQATRSRGHQPERVLDIIGIGAADHGSDIANFKDQYIGEAVEHRGSRACCGPTAGSSLTRQHTARQQTGMTQAMH
jgi:hypothetical protein